MSCGKLGGRARYRRMSKSYVQEALRSSRVQLALNVSNIDEAVAFYTRLFGAEPAKLRPGYANFVITEPPLKLVLLENPGHGGSLSHLGVEVPDIDTVDAEPHDGPGCCGADGPSSEGPAASAAKCC